MRFSAKRCLVELALYKNGKTKSEGTRVDTWDSFADLCHVK